MLQGVEGQARRPRHGHAQQAAVQAPVGHGLGDLGGVVLANLQYQARVAGAALPQGEWGEFMGGGRAGEGDHEPACLALGQQLHAALQCVEVVHQAGGLGLQCLPRLGQGDALGVALEQHHAHRVFQGLDLLAERRLGHAQQLGRTGHVPGLGHREKVAQLADVHVSAWEQHEG